MSEFETIKVGDTVIRMLAGQIPMKLRVSEVDDLIHCGDWTFSRKNGAEIDDVIGWNETYTGSFLVPPSKAEILTTDGLL